MADKQNPDDPTYDWLYSGRTSDRGDGGRDTGGDPEATQRFTPSHDPDATQRYSPGGGDPDATQRYSPGGGDPDATRQHTRGSGADDATRQFPPAGAAATAPGTAQQSQPERPTSFGGTYDSPSRPEQRYHPASPSDTQTLPPVAPPTRRGRPPRRPRPRRRRNWWLRGILALVLAWVIFLVAVPLWALSQISKVDAEPSGERPEDTPGSTYLLVGSDSREDLSAAEREALGTGDAEGGRTDTIIVLHVPDNQGPTLLLSLPRDSYVTIPGQGENKINAAYAFGGPELLVATVEQNTGLRVDSYIEVGFTGFVDVVNAVGGVEVCPTAPINDPQAGNLTMDEGCQDIDGETALQYSRSRAFGNGDITRAIHQREVIGAVGQRAASWQTVVLPWRYFGLNKAGSESLTTGEDVGPFDLTRFAWAMARSSGSDATRCVVPISSLGASTPVGSAVIWDDAAAQEIFDEIASDDTVSVECTETGQ